jgi:hypothetical protein
MKKLIAFLLFFCLFTFNLCLASQNALVVPDGTGAQVRAGFNNAIDSLNTVESGPSAPTTTEAYMLWCDTTNNLLKQRDSTNSIWITLGALGAAQMGHEPAITAGTTSQYWRGDKTWQTLPSGLSYPGAGVPLSTGSAWGTSYAVGTSANNLVQLNGSGQLPAVSGANLTNLPTSGGLTKVGATTITAAASTTIAGLSAGVQYLAVLNLTQNTSAGFISVQFNSDTGSNYNYAGMLGGAGFGGGYQSAVSNITLNWYGSYPAGISTYCQGDLRFGTVTGNNNRVAMNWQGNYVDSGPNYRSVTISGQYAGSAALSSITILTSAGTLSGTVTIYQYN